jgi:DNA-binding GntR family transcriptional regulator
MANSIDSASPRAVTWSSKTDVAYMNLRDQLLDGRLRPGTLLDQEALARDLGLSTTPVREALRRLEVEGLILQGSHRAVRVPELSLKELKELYSIRLQLDPWAAQLGAQAATDEHRAELRVLADDESTYAPKELLVRNRRLHRLMYATSGNAELTTLLDGLWDRCDRYRMILVSDEHVAHAAGNEHRRLVDAFNKPNLDRLGQLLTKHLNGSYETLRARLQ